MGKCPRLEPLVPFGSARPSPRVRLVALGADRPDNHREVVGNIAVGPAVHDTPDDGAVDVVRLDQVCDAVARSEHPPHLADLSR